MRNWQGYQLKINLIETKDSERYSAVTEYLLSAWETASCPREAQSLMGVGGTQVTPQHCGVMTSCPGLHTVSKEGISGPIFSQIIGEGRARQVA